MMRCQLLDITRPAPSEAALGGVRIMQERLQKLSTHLLRVHTSGFP
jgi:hypothetical protein